MFAEKSFCPPLTESYLRKQKFTPSAVYELPFKITIEKKLRRFQFKLIQNILPTNQCLWKMNVKSSPTVRTMCSLNFNFFFCWEEKTTRSNRVNFRLNHECDAPCDTISHIFYECPAVKIFWEKVIDWWNRKRSESKNPNPTEVLCGSKPECNSFHTFNHYLLIARYYVYLARNKFETPKLEVFIVLLGPVVRTPVSANPGLNFNQGFFFF